MRKFEGTCSPEQLHTLQRVFDLIWMELRASSMSSYSGPSDPDALRDEIARRVLSHYDGDGPDGNEITQRVLKSFGFTSAATGQDQGDSTRVERKRPTGH
jgi:hypothetical protein